MHAVRWNSALVLLVTLVLVAGCARSVGQAAVTPSVSPTPSASGTASTSAGGLRVGTAHATLDLPAGVVWATDGERRTTAGAHILRWRYQPAGPGPACVVTLGEVDGYTGAFPSAAIAAFDSLREPGVETVHNEAVPPPPGAVAAVRQEQRFVSARPTPAGTAGRAFARQVLTDGAVLVSVAAAAPDPAADVCRPEQVVGSLRLESVARVSTSTSEGPS